MSIVRVAETRLMYPMLADFSTTVSVAHRRGRAQVLHRPDDRSPTSTARRSAASWICIARRIAAGGTLKLSGVQKRVETMLTMTGAQNFLEIHADEPSAVKSFGA